MTTSTETPGDTATAGVHLALECRPSVLVAARYDKLPFPNIGPVQEIALDLGITAKNGDAVVSGLVFQGYNGHQLLFEQRWPARIISQRTGEEDLTVGSGTGLALRSLHFILHAYEPITHLDVTAVAAPVAGGESVQALLPIPVVTHQQQTDLHFPLEGAWWAIQAGDWSDFHKSEVYSQPYAIDFVKLGPDGQTNAGNGRSLTDHYSWDQPVYATAGGKVAYVCFDMPDMLPGAVPDQAILRGDMRRILGNAVAISHANGEFSYYAHLQQLSLTVNEGDVIRRGALIGRVGNSGNSPGPHLHFHVMNGPNLFIDQGLPMQFSHFWAGGQFYEEPMTIPTRMIVVGPAREQQ
ncbi:MAG: M23 family metallopeptidase [Caldilineaceae bacterium]|nr:M23 family metallopeptidase [Caldilineaceae bacterium]